MRKAIELLILQSLTLFTTGHGSPGVVNGFPESEYRMRDQV
jgi:hypothetical protein